MNVSGKDNKKIVLCTSKNCCPVVEINNSEVFITDDYGGKVTLTKEELIKLINETKYLIGE